MKIRIDFIITSLGAGGAQQMLLKLLTQIDREVFQPRVISLVKLVSASKDIENKLIDIDVPVFKLDLPRSLPGPSSIIRLTREIRLRKPLLIITWLYHADLLGGIAAKLAGVNNVVWNIRNSDLEVGSSKRFTILTVKFCSLLSRVIPERIICCAHSAQKIHAKLGYENQRMLVIPNGFNLDEFRPCSKARDQVRKEFGIPADAFVVGFVARFDPQKDHQNLIAAAVKMKAFHEKTHFILCGDSVTWENQELSELVRANGLADCTHLLGHREDIYRVINAFDVATSSSRYGEAFPNAVGEAMACGIPCVVTDVGDSKMIVGEDSGITVNPCDPDQLCAGWQQIADMAPFEREELGQNARKRVEENFSLRAVTSMYENLFFELAGKSRPRNGLTRD